MQTAQFFSLVTVSRGAFVDMIATRYAATRSSSSALEHLLRTSAANVVRARGVAYSASNRRPLASHNSSETAWRCSKCVLRLHCGCAASSVGRDDTSTTGLPCLPSPSWMAGGMSGGKDADTPYHRGTWHLEVGALHRHSASPTLILLSQFTISLPTTLSISLVKSRSLKNSDVEPNAHLT